jgi:hypothetical protein
VDDPQTKIRSAPAGTEDRGQQASVDRSLPYAHPLGVVVNRPLGVA